MMSREVSVSQDDWKKILEYLMQQKIISGPDYFSKAVAMKLINPPLFDQLGLKGDGQEVFDLTELMLRSDTSQIEATKLLKNIYILKMIFEDKYKNLKFDEKINHYFFYS